MSKRKKQWKRLQADPGLRYFLTAPANHFPPTDPVPITFEEVENRVRALRDREAADKILLISSQTIGIIYLHGDGEKQDDCEAILIRNS